VESGTLRNNPAAQNKNIICRMSSLRKLQVEGPLPREKYVNVKKIEKIARGMDGKALSKFFGKIYKKFY
jgi:hypothetical protein